MWYVGHYQRIPLWLLTKCICKFVLKVVYFERQPRIVLYDSTQLLNMSKIIIAYRACLIPELLLFARPKRVNLPKITFLTVNYIITNASDLHGKIYEGYKRHVKEEHYFLKYSSIVFCNDIHTHIYNRCLW